MEHKHTIDIHGLHLPAHSRLDIALSKAPGIGRPTAERIAKQVFGLIGDKEWMGKMPKLSELDPSHKALLPALLEQAGAGSACFAQHRQDVADKNRLIDFAKRLQHKSSKPA